MPMVICYIITIDKKYALTQGEPRARQGRKAGEATPRREKEKADSRRRAAGERGIY